MTACLVTLACGTPNALAATAPAPTAPAATAPAAHPPVVHHPPPHHPDVALSNERTKTTWTTADYYIRIRSAPNSRARALASLQSLTPDGFLQSYVLLREHWVGNAPWVLLRIPMRPNGKVGWVPRWALDQFQVVHTQLVVNRETTRLTFYRNGRVAYTAPVGTGKPSTPTPAGHFWITESFSVPWGSIYGPYAFGTSDYSTLSDWPGGGIVGLHGTDQPSLVPGHPSHGCIRLHNSDVLALSRMVPIGTPLLII